MKTCNPIYFRSILNRLNGYKCKGAKPGTFYYPHECDSFYSEYENQQRLEQEEQEEQELDNYMDEHEDPNDEYDPMEQEEKFGEEY